MKIAVEGCAHGELDKIYESLAVLEKENNIHIDLLIICGDFQAVRNPSDLLCMAVPPKYRKLNTFYKYYSGEKIAPVLTLFIGGNHEASNYLSELPYGGWVCTNIYYMGLASVINVGGIRIAGISGIYKGSDYTKGHFEIAPYNDSSVRSVYHIRNIDVFRLKQIKKPIDICISHDWPKGVYNYGDMNALFKKKPFFREEMESNKLGSSPAMELLQILKPAYWFAAHLHCKFAAIVPHGDAEQQTTKFLALDKCLPRRNFLQILDIDSENAAESIQYDPEWLCILRNTDHLLCTKRQNAYMPGPGGDEKWDFSVTEEDIENISKIFNANMQIPKNFIVTGPVHKASNDEKMHTVKMYENPQTLALCQLLNIQDPFSRNTTNVSNSLSISDFNSSDVDTSYQSINHDEISVSDDEINTSAYDTEREQASCSSALSTNIDKLSFIDAEKNTSTNIIERDILDSSDFFIDKVGSHVSSTDLQCIESNEFFIDRLGSQDGISEPDRNTSDSIVEDNINCGSSQSDDIAEDQLNLSSNAHTFLKTQFCSTPISEKNIQDKFPEFKKLGDCENDNIKEVIPVKKLKRRNWSLYNSDDPRE